MVVRGERDKIESAFHVTAAAVLLRCRNQVDEIDFSVEYEQLFKGELYMYMREANLAPTGVALMDDFFFPANPRSSQVLQPY